MGPLVMMPDRAARGGGSQLSEFMRCGARLPHRSAPYGFFVDNYLQTIIQFADNLAGDRACHVMVRAGACTLVTLITA